MNVAIDVTAVITHEIVAEFDRFIRKPYGLEKVK